MTKHHKKQIKRKIYRQLGWPMRSRGYYSMIKRWPSFFVMDKLIAVRPMDGPTGKVFYLNLV